MQTLQRPQKESNTYLGTWRPHKPRGPIGAMSKSPGPKYALPGAIGSNDHDLRKKRAAAFSFGSRHKQFSCTVSNECSPGPTHFVKPNITRNGVDGTPKYSLYGRHRSIKSFQAPGPGTYRPEKVSSPYKSAPSYSLSARTKGQVTQSSPGAAAYALPVQIGNNVKSKKSAPAYSMTSRHGIGGFAEDLKKTPGPGTYRPIDPSLYRIRQPIYSMTGRNLQPGDATKKPGPGAHSPEKVNINKHHPAKYSFGIRHSEYVAPVFFHVHDD